MKFFVESGIPTGGSINIDFPGSYTTDLKAGSCGVTNGLTPAFGDTVTCTIAGRTVTWSNFKAISPTELELYVTATNPNAAKSGNFIIETKTSDNVTIDKKDDAKDLEFSSVDCPVDARVDTFEIKQEAPIGTAAPIDIYL
jgi:hypothetical protein